MLQTQIIGSQLRTILTRDTFDEQVIADPLPDVPQGEIAIGLQTVVSGLSHLIGLADPNDGTGRLS